MTKYIIQFADETLGMAVLNRGNTTYDSVEEAIEAGQDIQATDDRPMYFYIIDFDTLKTIAKSTDYSKETK